METENSLPRHHRQEYKPRDRFFRIRNVLNIIFMLGAVVGVAVYLFGNRTVGTVIILAAMVFKIVECCLRFIK